jgi:hypothetical protein
MQPQQVGMMPQGAALIPPQIPPQMQTQPIQNPASQIQNQNAQVPPGHLNAQQIPAVSQTAGMVLPPHQAAVPVPNSQTPHQVLFQNIYKI